MKKTYLLLFALAFSTIAAATVYHGRVVDQRGEGIGYATVYPESAPVQGTASNMDGLFRFEANLTQQDQIIISFIGYEKQAMPAMVFAGRDTAVIVLREQPIALEETVVAAKASKQKNKKKKMAALLHSVYVQMDREFAHEPSQYQIVSDVRMDSHNEAWGMEQMIARIVVLPERAKSGSDSVQFAGQYCKRFFSQERRAKADTILAGQTLEHIDKHMRRAANAVDSGVVVHRALFEMGNMRYDFEQSVNDIRNWSVSNESEGETVLTHKQTYSKYLGCLKIVTTRHYILDSRTYAVRRFSEHMDVQVTIPFGIKLNPDQLQLLNLMNMSEQQIEKFRLRKMNAKIDLNTIYQRRNEHVYIQEKNMRANANIIGSQKQEIPLVIHATQRVTSLQTDQVKPMKKQEITRRLKRQIVEIY